MVTRSALVDVRPFRTGLVVATFGLMLTLGKDQGGYLGQRSAAPSASRSARPARRSSASCCCSSAGSCSRARRSARSSADSGTRFTGTCRARRRRRRGRRDVGRGTARAEAATKPVVDAETSYPDVVEPAALAPSPLLTLEPEPLVDPAGAALRRHHDRASRVHASGSQRPARLAGEAGRVGRDRRARRRAPRADARALRHRRDRDRPDLRPARDALRAAARAGHEGVEGRRA